MELQVEEDLVAPVFQFFDDLRTRCVEQFHADLDERPFFPELLQEPDGLFSAREVTGDDDVFSH